MPDEEKTGSSPDLIQGAINRIRDVTKWLVGGLGAVATALVASTQLSSLGQVCGPYDSVCWRLGAAMLAGAVALVGLGYAAKSALQVLVPREFTLSSLVREWGKQDRSPVFSYFRANPETLQSLGDPPQIRTLRENHLRRFRELSERWSEADPAEKAQLALQVKEAHAYLEDLEKRIAFICDIAAYQALSHDFRHRRSRGVFISGAMAAFSIVVFAWLSNPPARTVAPVSIRRSVLAGADLSGSSLRGADLTGADLSRAILRGADLQGAIVKDVKWDSTICPDGTNSDDAHDSCEGHLAP